MHRFTLGGLQEPPFTENKGEDVANYIKKGRIFANVKGKVVKLVTLVLGRFSTDFRKLL